MPAPICASHVVHQTEGRSVTVPTRAERLAPEVTTQCHRCGRETPTLYRMMRSGHVGNLCAVCGTCRHGRPYVPLSYLDTNPEGPRPRAVKGQHEHDRR